MRLDLQNSTAAEIATLMDEKEKELSEALASYHAVEQEKLYLQREILERQTKKKDLEISLSKATHTIRQLQIDLKILRNRFFAAKDAGC